MRELTDTHRAALDIESRPWHCQGCKERTAHELGLSPTRYYAVLNHLIDQPAGRGLRTLS